MCTGGCGGKTTRNYEDRGMTREERILKSFQSRSGEFQDSEVEIEIVE
jgi:hypothetical protein